MTISVEVSHSPQFKALQFDTYCHYGIEIYNNSVNQCTGIKPGSTATVQRVIFKHENNKVA